MLGSYWLNGCNQTCFNLLCFSNIIKSKFYVWHCPNSVVLKAAHYRKSDLARERLGHFLHCNNVLSKQNHLSILNGKRIVDEKLWGKRIKFYASGSDIGECWANWGRDWGSKDVQVNRSNPPYYGQSSCSFI